MSCICYDGLWRIEFSNNVFELLGLVDYQMKKRKTLETESENINDKNKQRNGKIYFWKE